MLKLTDMLHSGRYMYWPKLFTNRVGFDTKAAREGQRELARTHSYSTTQPFGACITSLENCHHTYSHLNRFYGKSIITKFAIHSFRKQVLFKLKDYSADNVIFKVLHVILFFVRLECCVCTCVSRLNFSPRVDPNKSSPPWWYFT